MPINNISSHLISKLGSPNSKIPLAVKDVFNSAGYTYFSYDAGGSVEGKDRLVDEVGTGLIWLFGIPAYRKLIDKTLYKFGKVSPEVDVRVIKNADYLKSAIENAPTEKIAEELKKAGNNIPKNKAFAFLKFALALGMTLASYCALTKFKQNMTKKSIEKEFLKKQTLEQEQEQKQEKISPYTYNSTPIFDEIEGKKSSSKISFGSAGLVSLAEDFMLNPIKNMIILDTGISGLRLKESRGQGEFAEYAIKEGSFLFFVYAAGKLISSGIDKLSEKLFNAPIDLDAKFLSSDSAKNLLENSSLKQNAKDFAKMLKDCKNQTEIYDFIFKNQNNIVVKAAKKSGIISTIKDSTGIEKIDTRKFIDIKEMQKLSDKLLTFIDKSNGTDINKYLSKVKNLKIVSTLLNVGACCLALGYIVPKIMYKYREKHQNGNKDFHVRTEYEKELEAKQNK